MKKITYSKIENVDDIEILRDRQSFNYTFDSPTIELLKANFSLEGSLYVLAKEDDVFVGFCSIDKDWWEESYFFIREIVVDSSFLKQNVGYTIMSMCIEHAKKEGADGIITETDFKNLPMQKLCKKFGFKGWDNPKWKEGITYKLVF